MDHMHNRVSSMSTTSGTAARTIGDVTQSTAHDHDERALKWYLSEANLRMPHGEHYCTTFDASRLGNPAEETIFYCLENLDSGLACWLPPQVPSLSKQTFTSGI